MKLCTINAILKCTDCHVKTEVIDYQEITHYDRIMQMTREEMIYKMLLNLAGGTTDPCILALL